MTAQSDEALEALRQIWRNDRPGVAGIDEACEQPSGKACRNAVHIGFDGLADEEDANLEAAWQRKLAADGKLNTAGGTLRDLMLANSEVPASQP